MYNYRSREWRFHFQGFYDVKGLCISFPLHFHPSRYLESFVTKSSIISHMGFKCTVRVFRRTRGWKGRQRKMFFTASLLFIAESCYFNRMWLVMSRLFVFLYIHNEIICTTLNFFRLQLLYLKCSLIFVRVPPSPSPASVRWR